MKKVIFAAVFALALQSHAYNIIDGRTTNPPFPGAWYDNAKVSMVRQNNTNIYFE